MYLAKIHVTLKPSVLDPQGVAVGAALKHMGYREVAGLRQGKYLELLLEGKGLSQAKAKVRVTQMCVRLLANTQIERYEFSLSTVKTPKGLKA
ncbi:MAG: phosphoribosylformylglycinamidine synthase subunit PurS [bacterium]